MDKSMLFQKVIGSCFSFSDQTYRAANHASQERVQECQEHPIEMP